ncbi:MAG: hypothetical protein LBJ41_08205 [Treponema sp.]|jgi:tetratricopeptide (TPR) repeat protein|nr:hypothetical protein [Treponema sp.]
MRTKISIGFLCTALCCWTISASATPIYHKSPEPSDAKQYIIDALTQNKLVFIGKDHAQVNEELFMAENLQAFYDAGLRYIFVEGAFTEFSPVSGQSSLPVDNRIWLFPPWRTDVGEKYEENVLYQAVLRINVAVPYEEHIRFIPVDAGYEETDLNKREQEVFNNISAFMEKLPPQKKALIFYGDAHGRTKPAEWRVLGGESFLWTPMGVYLKERYGDNFISMLSPISAKDERYNLYQNIPELRDFASRTKVEFAIPSHYDAVIVDEEIIFGTGKNYMPTYENLFAMYNNLRYLEGNIDTWKDAVATLREEEQGQYLQLIYYLKLWLGDSFNYRFWDTVKPVPVVIRLRDTRNSLREALDNLNTSTIQEIARTLNAQDAQSTQRMYAYSKAMLLSALTDFLYGEDTAEVFIWIADHMKEAITLFPQDLWSYYWLAYSETELGDYDAAIEHWEYIIAQPSSYCLETLPRVYQKLSACYAVKGDLGKSYEYKMTGESLLNEHDLVVTNLNDVR